MNGSWDALIAAPGNQLVLRRAEHAAALSAQLHRDAASLQQRWSRQHGDFAGELAGAGSEGTVYGSAQLAANAVSDAMFYLEAVTKDTKLAVPAGLSDCDADACPQALESTYARYSKQQIEQNLLAFELMFHGGDPANQAAVGFDDWLRARDAADLADRIVGGIAAAKKALAAVPGADLAEALESGGGIERVRKLHDAIKTITDTLKVEVVTVLDLELPQTVQGDND